jgi:hypothetical protein
LLEVGVEILAGHWNQRQTHLLQRLEGSRGVGAGLEPNTFNVRVRGEETGQLSQRGGLVVLDVGGADDLDVRILVENLLGSGPARLADGDAGWTIDSQDLA